MEYFICELLGHDPLNPCEWKNFETDALVFLSSMLPVVNLIFTVSVQDVKNKCQVLHRRMKRMSTSKAKNTTCSTAESKKM